MSSTADKTVYELLQKTVNEKAYGSIELNKALERMADKSEKPYVTALFYGVLQKSLQFDYIIGKLAEKPPKNAIKLILKIGLYKLRYMNVPDHAAVDCAVELCKSVGKGGAAGFVNAVLRKSKTISLPPVTDAFSLSVAASVPEFLTELLISDYGFDFATELLMANLDDRTHIRRNGIKISESEFEKEIGVFDTKKTSCGYYVTHNTLEKLNSENYIVQSLSSMLAVRKFFCESDRKILDLCSAPGGKSVYLYELHKGNADITACDIRPHRVALIEKYARKVGAKLNIMQNDATAFRAEFENGFDCVICDVPCSGIGVIGKKPEIALKISFGDLDALESTQRDILSTAARYVKFGGRLCYSTCTVLKRENDAIIENFLKENKNFELTQGGVMRLFPNVDGCDGFFAAVMQRVK